jgi:hypothetical protein
MHGSVREELENLLAGKPSAAAIESARHISACQDCAQELQAMSNHAQMLKTLRPSEEFEPTAGFYARVMQRIEATAKRSIWWVFVYSPIGKRVAYASLALTVAMGTYMITAESLDGHLTAGAMAAAQDHFDAVVTGSADEQRAAVLENFVAHPSNLQPIEMKSLVSQ